MHNYSVNRKKMCVVEKTVSLTSVYFRRLPLPNRSGEILDIGVVPVAFTGCKPAMKYIFDQREA